ncbi:hypothetical protein [Aeromonas dhakensis]|uniref:hypothetical protein n=1 Tax=Aeromonas dhakensis TaxID=196024 RepID=UPI003B9EFBD8
MTVDELFEITFENLVDKNRATMCEYIPDCLESLGYLATFHYSRGDDNKTNVTYLLQDFHFRQNTRFGEKTNDERKQETIDFLKKEWDIKLPKKFIFMDELDGMVELSKNIAKVYSRNECAYEIEAFLSLAITPLINFLSDQLQSLSCGIKSFSDYEKLIGIFLNLYFMSDNYKVIRQVSNATNQHRRDFHVRIKDTNSRLFNKLIDDTKCKSIVVECKNSKEKSQLKKAIAQVNNYSYSASFGELGLVFVRKKGNPFKLTDYVNSPCVILIFDDDDIENILSEMSSSINRFRYEKKKDVFSQEISACHDLYDRYQEFCEK